MSALRRSANPAYKRVVGLAEFESCVVDQIGESGPLTLTKLAALLGHDKAQVSRAAKRLTADGLVSKPKARGALHLTAEGRDTFKRLRHLAHSRNATLTGRLGDHELRLLPVLLERLEHNACSFFANEQPSHSEARSQAAVTARLSDAKHIRRLPRDAASRSIKVFPALLRLFTVLRSTALPAYGSVNGMQDFEWNLISQLGRRGTLTSIELVELMNRDKSQVSRAVQRLTAREVITARKIGAGRHVLLSITERGQGIYNQLLRVGIERNIVLRRGLTEAESSALLQIIKKLDDGAAELITKEQAIAKPQTLGIARAGQLKIAQ